MGGDKRLAAMLLMLPKFIVIASETSFELSMNFEGVAEPEKSEGVATSGSGLFFDPFGPRFN
jgi:hypothetical protein